MPTKRLPHEAPYTTMSSPLPPPLPDPNDDPSNNNKNDPSPMKTEEQPSAKKQRKDDDERVTRAARLMLKSTILSVPQAMLCNDFT